ncbi:MAG: SRPBCC domain-containing protein [Planctomycetota bacterium]|nr:SRPBCC domain-containing protein [Planctomycetota bacterium]
MDNDASHSPSYMLSLARTFAAPIEEVFGAFTDPALLAQWWAPRGYLTPIANLDVRVGGEYRIGMHAEETPDELMFIHGTYREVNPPNRLVFTYVWEPDGAGARWVDMGVADHVTLVIIEFHSLGASTRVKLEHDRFPNTESRDAHIGGWTSCLDCFEDFLHQSNSSPKMEELP